LIYVTAKSNREELEKLYIIYSDYPCEPTEKGRKQFYDYETHGEKPTEPDPFYKCLENGKKWFSVDQDSIRKSFLTMFRKNPPWEWNGYWCYWKYFEGERWILRYLFAWHNNPPEWMFHEEEPDLSGLIEVNGSFR
jgi:hypothetical protein